MSKKYREYGSVPTDVLANRLLQLSAAVGKSSFEMLSEYTRRIPAELDRDADLVLSQSARRMTELEVKLKKVTAERDAVCLAVFDQRGKPVNAELLSKVRAIAKDIKLSNTNTDKGSN